MFLGNISGNVTTNNMKKKPKFKERVNGFSVDYRAF